MTTDIQQLELLLEYRFRDHTLLAQALTHPSYLHEAGGSGGGDYQRLEFLGDARLGLLLAEMLYTRYPDWDEGALSQLRSGLPVRMFWLIRPKVWVSELLSSSDGVRSRPPAGRKIRFLPMFWRR